MGFQVAVRCSFAPLRHPSRVLKNVALTASTSGACTMPIHSFILVYHFTVVHDAPPLRVWCQVQHWHATYSSIFVTCRSIFTWTSGSPNMHAPAQSQTNRYLRSWLPCNTMLARCSTPGSMCFPVCYTAAQRHRAQTKLARCLSVCFWLHTLNTCDQSPKVVLMPCVLCTEIVCVEAVPLLKILCFTCVTSPLMPPGMHAWITVNAVPSFELHSFTANDI